MIIQYSIPNEISTVQWFRIISCDELKRVFLFLVLKYQITVTRTVPLHLAHLLICARSATVENNVFNILLSGVECLFLLFWFTFTTIRCLWNEHLEVYRQRCDFNNIKLSNYRCRTLHILQSDRHSARWDLKLRRRQIFVTFLFMLSIFLFSFSARFIFSVWRRT